VRARLYALSEIPDQWSSWVAEWRELNRHHKTWIDGRLAPDANEEYRFYQTLLGCWPVAATPGQKPDGNGGAVETAPFVPDEAFRQRLREHVRKAINEAKRNTHWLHPNEPWIEAFERFVTAVLSPETGASFLASFQPKAERLAHLGVTNALAQLALKVTSPGVPDFYQGCEWWNLTLVDPDNRGVIDWSGRDEVLAQARAASWHELLRRWRDGAIKLRLTADLLRFRAEHRALFRDGEYVPVAATGRFADRLVIFERRTAEAAAVVVVPRLTAMLGVPPLGLVWEDTMVALPNRRGGWHGVLAPGEWAGGKPAAVAELFGELPLALLSWKH
jgi:(1->4)-alpha-D-glucan 1-alpha-D-glucosylmutase